MKSIYQFFRKVRFLLVKELKATVNDPLTRTVLVVPIILQCLFFGYAATFNLESVPYALLDASHSQASTEFVSHIDGTGIFQRVRTLTSSNQIADAIDSGDALLVVYIDQNFADNLAAGKSGSIEVILDGRNSTTAGIASGYISSIVSAFNQSLMAKYGIKSPMEIISVSWFNPNLITRWMFIPSLLPLLSMIQVIMLAGLSVAREREQGTFDQLLVTPLSPRQILLGKAIPPILIGLTQCTIALLIAVLWFEIPFAGSLLTLYITLTIFMTSVVGIGLSISALSNSMQQVMVYCFVLLMPMSMLSGFATPVRNMPELMQYATYVNPLRFAIDATRRIYLEGAALGDIAINFIPMIIVACFTLPLAAWLFRNKLS